MDKMTVCETTMTPRFPRANCECDTYPENLGPCAVFEKGDNGNCVYCDHNEECHKTEGKNLVSDICICGGFRSQHWRNFPCTEFSFSRRCKEEDLERWVGLTIIGKRKK